MPEPPTHPFRRTRSFTRRTLTALCLSLHAIPAGAQDNASPWTDLERAPSAIELAIVMDDPATMLLSEDGAMSRGTLSALGLMPNTRRAWRALSDTLGLTSDDAIRTLLSGRVSLFLDWNDDARSADAAPFPAMLAQLDTRWVVSARIPTDTLDTLSRRLKPVPRDIVDGVLIYAIEQGRFSLAILPPETPGAQARLLLAPKSASRTLELALGSFRSPAPPDLPGAPIASADDTPCIAVRMRPELFPSGNAAVRFSGDGYVWAKLSAPAPDHARAEIALIPDPEHLDPLTAGGAPVHLLGAASTGTLAACAASHILRLDLREALGIDVSLDTSARTAPFTPRGALLLVTDPDDPDAPERLNVTTLLSRCEPGTVDARALDESMARAIGDGAPDFRGAFPGATRTHAYPSGSGTPAAVSWKVLDLGSSTDVIVSFAPTERAASAAVGRLADRVALIEALGVKPPASTTIARGTLDIARIFDLVSDTGYPLMPFPSGEIHGTLDWSVTLEDGVLRAVIEAAPNQGGAFPVPRPRLGAD